MVMMSDSGKKEETLSDEIKSMHISDYIHLGSSIPDVWAKNERMDFIKTKDVKKFIKKIEFDLLKRYKTASIPIMEIIKKRAGEDLK